ncbi:MAG: sulfurtransferase TusA family protein [Sphaerochaetaceae bacterium]|nr:sulfurtransferase TusA family protein [Sphaerochaetaceae bacterium]
MSEEKKMIVVDARGLSCPQPVIAVKKAIGSHCGDTKVIVDNFAAKENVARYAEAMGYDVSIEEQMEDGAREFRLNLVKKG